MLLDRDANKTSILRALKNMRAAMENGNGNDLAVIHFSGHGALVDHKLYLLPYDVDARDDAGIESNGLSVEELGVSWPNWASTGGCSFCSTPATPAQRPPMAARFRWINGVADGACCRKRVGADILERFRSVVRDDGITAWRVY